jgi:aconitate hydratase
VIAYALAGTTRIDLTAEPIGVSSTGEPVYLRDIWPSNRAIADEVLKVNERMFRKHYADVFSGDAGMMPLPIFVTRLISVLITAAN